MQPMMEQAGMLSEIRVVALDTTNRRLTIICCGRSLRHR